ncbi:MAG: putative 2OG-Fe(II) oxygenase [Pseudomonadota bacterium]
MPEMSVENLFPTPVMRVSEILDDTMIERLCDHIRNQPTVANKQTGLLTHTQPIAASELPELKDLMEMLQPYLRDFGFLLFGENLDWTVKEIWMNHCTTGGHQLIHSHANSFISGVLYLTDIDPSARTIFHRGMGGSEFAFTNKHAESATTAYNADRWVPDSIQRGDLILFPSYMLHAVPPNEGSERITVAMNALPHRLKSWDYEVSFSSN